MDHVVSIRPNAPFIGRTAELERLRQVSQAAATGKAAAVLIAGDAGVGKTTLITEATRWAEGEGLLVLSGRCVDLGTGALPYLPFAEALTKLIWAGEPDPAGPDPNPGAGWPAAQIIRQAAEDRPALARIAGWTGPGPAGRSPGDTGLDRLALFEAVAYVLSRISDEVSPVMMVLEDLHWADASTRDLLRFLLARLGTDRLIVVGSYRGDDLHRRHPLRSLLRELLRLPQVERMELLPFAATELAEFLSSVRGEPVPEELLRRITARSAGNPYYAQELLAAGDDDRLPAGLADVLLGRLEQLTPSGQQLVRMASVLGSARIDDSLLRGAVRDLAGPAVSSGPAPAADGDPGMEIEHAVREALAHQVLIPDGPDRYAFAHALLQEAVYTDLLPGERVRRHGCVAHRLALLGAADEKLASRLAAELARHSLAAHDLPLALEASLRAAAEARCDSAPAQALAHYEQALQLWDVVEPGRRPPGRRLSEIGVGAAAAAGDTGLPVRAVQLATAALEDAGRGADPREVAAARAALALHNLAADRPLPAREQARKVVSELDDEPPSAARVLARMIEARVDLSMAEPEAALEVIPAALAEAEVLGLLGLTAELLITSAVGAGMVGRADVAQQWAAARAAAERAGDEAALIRVLYSTSVDRIDRGDLSGGVDLLTEALQVADDSGLTGSQFGARSRALMITTRWRLGDAEGALAVVRHTSDGSPTGQLPSAVLAGQLRLFELPVQAARDPEHVLAAGQWLMTSAGPWDNQTLQTARAEALSWLGRWPESAAAAQKALDFLAADPEPYPLAGIAISTTAVASLADVAAAARERGDHNGERQAIDAAARFVDDGRARGRYGRPRRLTMGPEGVAWLLRLETEAARLTAADDADTWAGVVAAFEGVSVYEVARAQWRLAGTLLRSGRRDEARSAAVRARSAAVQLGARPLVAVLDELARRARFEVSKPAGPGPLTAREREVMILVAAGLTNRAIGDRLFISEKTASVHVSNVLAKLGASGRAEAVAIIGRRGLIG